MSQQNFPEFSYEMLIPEVRLSVLSVLGDIPFSTQDVAELAGVSPESAIVHLNALLADGKVESRCVAEEDTKRSWVKYWCLVGSRYDVEPNGAASFVSIVPFKDGVWADGHWRPQQCSEVKVECECGKVYDRWQLPLECECDRLVTFICPWISCRHHLYVDRTGGVMRWAHPGKEVWELRHTCSIEAARLNRGGFSMEDVGDMMGISKQRVEQIQRKALEKVEAAYNEIDGFDNV